MEDVIEAKCMYQAMVLLAFHVDTVMEWRKSAILAWKTHELLQGGLVYCHGKIIVAISTQIAPHLVPNHLITVAQQ